MSRSHPDNQKEVYKFWLGFFEKVTVLIVAAVILPGIVGQLSFQFTLAAGWVGVVLVLLVIMPWLSFSLWHLPKAEDNSQGDES